MFLYCHKLAPYALKGQKILALGNYGRNPVAL